MTETIRVLYVDDEPLLLELAKTFLEELGSFSVTTSSSAEKSLASADLVSFDAIISDYRMPVMDGIEFLKKVRECCGDIPFILFTGRGREEIVIQALNNGADFYLQKGGDPDALFAELAHKVRQAVARRKSEREITSIFQAVPVGIAVVADRVLVRVNDRLCTMTGYSRAELEGRNTRFLYLDDRDYQEVGRMREQAYRGEEPVDTEVRWRKKDGSVIDVRITAAAINRSNPMASMTYSALDITKARYDENELRAAYEQITASEEELREQYDDLAGSQERLRKSEAELASILRAAPIGIGLISADRVFLRVNDWFCSITGYTQEELTGRHTRFLYTDDDEYTRVAKFYSLGKSHGIVEMVKTRFLTKDGTMRDIRLLGTQIDPTSPAAGNIFIALDITDEKQKGSSPKK